MVVSLRIRYLTDTRSFKQVCSNSTSCNPPFRIELYLDKLAKTTGICGNIGNIKSIEEKIESFQMEEGETLMNYLELLFRTVFALPNASSTGLDWMKELRLKNSETAFCPVKNKKMVIYKVTHSKNKRHKLMGDYQTSKICCSTDRPSVAALPPI